MKKIFLTLFLVLGSFTIQAQELTWETDINKAIEVSKKTKKPLLLFFTGSDWCGWCIRLQNEVLKKPEFALAVFDVNNLKAVNDALGHEFGDVFKRADSIMYENKTEKKKAKS